MQDLVQDRFDKLEWMLDETDQLPENERDEYIPPYGDVTELNSCRLIMDSVGTETLKEIGKNAINLLETSVAIYEANGDYAFGMFSSGWCRIMDAASRELCKTDNNRVALSCGKWLCHENCWNDSAKRAIETGKSTDIECVGGIHLFAEPIYAGQRVVGAINIGYGDPPKSPDKLKALAESFDVDSEKLKEIGESYKSRPKFIVDVAKELLSSFAKLIGEIVEKAEAQQKQKEIQERESHLNDVLKAIRNVNQLIVKETDPADLIQKACENLTGAMGYFNAWIALLDKDNKRVTLTGEAGFNGGFKPMLESLNRGSFPFCLQHTLETGEAVVIADPVTECTDCPLASNYVGRASLVYHLEHGGRIFGFLSVSVPACFAHDSEERDLFLEISKDLAFALSKIETEKQIHIKNHIIQTIPQPISLISSDYRYLVVNEAYSRFYGQTPDKIIGRRITDFIAPEVFEQEYKPHLDQCLKSETVKFETIVDFSEIGDRWMRMEYTPFRDKDNRIVGVVSHGLDITERKQAEEQRQEGFDLLKNLARLIPGVIYQYRLYPDGRSAFPYSSPGMYDIYEVTPEEVREDASVVFGRLHPEDHDRVAEAIFESARTLNTFYCELRVILPKKGLGWRWSQAYPERTEDGGTLWHGIILDITKRKQAEQKLVESEAKFSAFMKHLPGFAYIKDFDRRHLFVNESLANFFEMENGEWLGKTFEQIFPVSQALQIKNTDEQLLKNRETLLVEEDLLVGETIQTYLSAKFPIETPEGEVLLGGVSVDITAMKKAEADRRVIQKELIERNQFIETILDNLPIGLAVNYINEGHAVYINKKFEEIYGWPKSDLEDIEQFLQKVYPDHSYRDQIKRRVTEDIQSGDPNRMVWDGFEATAQNGEKRTIFAKNIPLFEQNLMISTVQDITESRRLQERLQQAQKMEAIGNLAGGIAHDFNNILFPIIGFSELLLDDLPPESPEYDNVKQILIAGKRAGDLVKQILSFSRQTEHKTMPIRIQNILKEAVKLCRSTIPAYIDIEQDIQSDCAKVMANPTHIHQICMNLITNAYHALEDLGGKILLELKETVLESSDTEDALIEPGRYAVLMVSDTGCGMAPDIMGKIFEPYFTTKDQGKGTGLGLAVVYGIVKDYCGDIKVDSEIGKGTTLKVYLPVIDSFEDDDHMPLTEDRKTGKERILLVDDEESIAKLESQILERLGYKVILRTSSPEALKAFKASPESFDLVITDMNMPNIPGDQLAEKIIQIRPGLPVIICTGFSDRINRDRARAIGVKDFLKKPMVRSDLARLVREVLDEAKGKSCQ